VPLLRQEPAPDGGGQAGEEGLRQGSSFPSDVVRRLEGAKLYGRTQVCEDCKERAPGWGMPANIGGKRQRWCTVCAKNHEGAVRTIGKKCADCGLKWSAWGTPDGEVLWCSKCAKNHEVMPERC
jgi:hypothetical protein